MIEKTNNGTIVIIPTDILDKDKSFLMLGNTTPTEVIGALKFAATSKIPKNSNQLIFFYSLYFSSYLNEFI